MRFFIEYKDKVYEAKDKSAGCTFCSLNHTAFCGDEKPFGCSDLERLLKFKRITLEVLCD